MTSTLGACSLVSHSVPHQQQFDNLLLPPESLPTLAQSALNMFPVPQLPGSNDELCWLHWPQLTCALLSCCFLPLAPAGGSRGSGGSLLLWLHELLEAEDRLAAAQQRLAAAEEQLRQLAPIGKQYRK